MANQPDIPRQSLGDFYVAQNSYQGHQGITGWNPQMTQSLGGYALQSTLQAATPPQQSPPKVGTPVKYIKDFLFTHGPFWCIAGSANPVGRYTPAVTTRLRAVLRRCSPRQFFNCARRRGIEGNRIGD